MEIRTTFALRSRSSWYVSEISASAALILFRSSRRFSCLAVDEPVRRRVQPGDHVVEDRPGYVV
jgi:hypothetical protein